jgi:hypothetical protein
MGKKEGAATAEDGGRVDGHAGSARRWGRRRLAVQWFRVGGGGDNEESRLGFLGAAAVRSSDEVSDCRSFSGWRRTDGGRR